MIDEREERRYEEQRRRQIALRRERMRKKRIRQLRRRACLVVTAAVVIGLSIHGIRNAKAEQKEEEVVMSYESKIVTLAPDILVDLIDINEYSRPGTPLEEVNGIVVHYTGNPGTTAVQNRSYFQSLAETGENSASSHYVVGIDGEIIQCVPCNEIAYASNDRNSDTLSIECCTPEANGKFTDATYDSLVQLVCYLMGRYELTTDQVIRHYDVTGKECPRYYVKNPEAWEQFKEDLLTYIDTYCIEKKAEIN